MIPGTIDEWKRALANSKPGGERNVCVEALLLLGAMVQIKNDDRGFIDYGMSPCVRESEYRVKPTARSWNSEDAKRHIGYAFRKLAGERVVIVTHLHGEENALEWNGHEYAAPIPGTDPSTWDWKKCEVVE